jgi:hypothetical protein
MVIIGIHKSKAKVSEFLWQRHRGREGGRDEQEHEHEQELEVPIICARKVETTPVPDLDIYDAEKVNVSTGTELKHDLEDWDLPYFQTEPRSERTDSIGVCLECVQENERVFCFSRCSNQPTTPTVGYGVSSPAGS